MKIPSHKECMELLDEYNVPENVRKHSFAVNRVAVFLAKKLQEKGIEINIDLVDRATLLHDLDKIATLKTGDHGQITRKILEERGSSVIGKIIHQHLFIAVVDPGLNTWEEKVAGYADKRCNEDQIVSLQERFEYGNKRYGHIRGYISEAAEEGWRKLEKEIFEIIELDPNELAEAIAKQEGKE